MPRSQLDGAGDGAPPGLTDDGPPGLDSKELVPDDIFDRHLGADADDGPPIPGDGAFEPDESDDGATPQGDLGDEDFDNDDDFEEGDDDEYEDDLDDDDLDDLEDDELEEELDDEEEDDEDADEDFLGGELGTKDLAKINKSPELQRMYRRMQAGFTKRMDEAARMLDEGHSLRIEHEDFMNEIQTPAGAVAFLKEQVLRVPELVGAAFEAVATEEGAVDFLVEVALANDEAFQKAAERIEDLRADPRELEIHKRQRELDSRERKDEQRRTQAERRQRRQRTLEIRRTMEKFAGRDDIHEEDLPELRQRVGARIQQNARDNGKADISTEELRREVRAFAKEMQKRESRLRKRYGTGKGRKPTRKASSKGKRTKQTGRRRNRVPGSGGVQDTSSTRGSKPKGPPPGVDPLDWAVEKGLQSIDS